MLQGKNRKERATLYLKHLAKVYGKKVHRMVIVPKVSHSSEQMWNSEVGRYELFGPMKPF